VHLSATAGYFEPSAPVLDVGRARATWTCAAADPACTGVANLSAEWEGVVATAQVRLLQSVTLGGDDGGSADAGEARDDPALADAGFRCDDWDGGVHPGYTTDYGWPLALGCQGQAIDYVLIESSDPASTQICGTVELTEPVAIPVILHAQLSGALHLSNIQMCCSAPRCLRDPRRITYRFAVLSMNARLGIGVKWNARTELQFGYYPGTVAAPNPTLADAGYLKVPEGTGAVQGVDFGIGRGWR